MKMYRILALTDHGGHSDQNSIYALLESMLQHEQCASMLVASRGLDINYGFFEGHQRNSLFGSTVGGDFSFTLDGQYFQKGLKKINPKEIDLVFMRLPRPISDDFLLWVEEVFGHAVIVNRPKGIIETSSKAFLLQFPGLSPSMRLVHSVAEVEAYAAEQDIVLKPLREYGGKGLLKIAGGKVDDGTQLYGIADYLPTIEDELQQNGYLAMKYLKNVTKGDKRILVVGGEVMAASLRLPADGSWLCNVAQGGTSVAAEPDADELAIVKAITPMLTDRGILIYGLDTLADDDGTRILSEVNTLSIGGFPQAEQQTGRPIIKNTINKIFEYANSRTK